MVFIVFNRFEPSCKNIREIDTVSHRIGEFIFFMRDRPNKLCQPLLNFKVTVENEPVPGILPEWVGLTTNFTT